MPSLYQPQAVKSPISISENVINPMAIAELDRVDFGQIYLLIDSILPFEACLYYQVLPLVIKGSRLTIGMVNPDDLEATDYVKKQLSYINYSLSFKTIPSDWHRDLLSKYLNHTAKQRQKATQQLAAPSESADSRSPQTVVNPANFQATFIVDQPTEFTEIVHDPSSVVDHTLELDVPASARHAAQPEEPTPPLEPPTDPTPVAITQPPEPDQDDLNPDLLHLRLDPQYGEITQERLLTLPPNALMQALLWKVLEEGIGRLYFERCEQGGRILWSRDGILQAMTDSIHGAIFQSVINEFKRLMHLTLIPVQKSTQVEIERSYQGQRVLLRLKIMPSATGEEGTLQVLRGTALRFYQQQQIDRLGRDALDAAQVLQNRLTEIRDRARHTLNFEATRAETLASLVQLLKRLESQVEEIMAETTP
jgi:type II secretory ATPase GspE/PulE/Tfp pilus assembly ATPase PilB-like protein